MNKNDKQIKELLDLVTSQEDSIGKIKRRVLNTNGIFHYDEKDFFNINTVSEVKTIINALAFLIEKESSWYKACDKLGVEETFLWKGYSFHEWLGDLKARLDYIQWNNRKDTLSKTKKRLNSLVSSEGKTQMEIDEIKKLLCGK